MDKILTKNTIFLLDAIKHDLDKETFTTEDFQNILLRLDSFDKYVAEIRRVAQNRLTFPMTELLEKFYKKEWKEETIFKLNLREKTYYFILYYEGEEENPFNCFLRFDTTYRTTEDSTLADIVEDENFWEFKFIATEMQKEETGSVVRKKLWN